MIRLVDVRKTFNADKPNEFTALKSISFEVTRESFVVLKGPSGSGKTTLLSLMSCMARPSAGRIFFNNQEITSLPERFLADIRRRSFGVIFQQFNLIKGLSLLENVMIPAYPSGEKFAVLKARALGLLDLLDITPRADAKIEWLSGGEAQRVAIARALINDPLVVIADEPTAHLDSRLSREFMGIMQRLNDGGKTILIASHDPVVYDSAAVERIVAMRDGQLETGGRLS